MIMKRMRRWYLIRLCLGSNDLQEYRWLSTPIEIYTGPRNWCIVRWEQKTRSPLYNIRVEKKRKGGGVRRLGQFTFSTLSMAWVNERAQILYHLSVPEVGPGHELDLADLHV
jgi:hypothetical protein